MAIQISYLIVISIAAVGLTYQVYHISDRYFQYVTKTIVIIENPLRINIPSISTCWNIDDILNKTALRIERGIHVPYSDDFQSDYTIYNEVKKKLKVSDYFKYTPSNESILQSFGGCTVRYPKKWSIKFPWPKAKECYEMFSIKKYLYRGMICYAFTLKDANQSIFIEQYSLVTEMTGLMFKVYMDKELFGNVSSFSAFVTSNDSSNFYDSAFAPKRFIHTSNLNDSLQVDLTYSSMTKSRMPSPYDTNCQNSPPFRSMAEKFFSIAKERLIKEINLIHSFTPIYEPNEHTLLGTDSLTNSTILDELNRIIDGIDIPPFFVASIILSPHRILDSVIS